MRGDGILFDIQQVEGPKEKRYQNLLQQVKGLLEDETDWLPNLANSASLLYHCLDRVNWAGYYLIRNDELVLGPFMGLPACIRIPLGKGVCGTAAVEGKTLVVPDVMKFPGHIPCDAASRSEIVIPLESEGKLLGVLDIDSPVVERFDDEDRYFLEQFVQLLIRKTDWTNI